MLPLWSSSNSKSCCHWLDIENNIYKMTSCTDKKNATVLGKMFKRSRTTYRQGCMRSNIHRRFWCPEYLERRSYMLFGQNVMNIVIKTIFLIFFSSDNTILGNIYKMLICSPENNTRLHNEVWQWTSSSSTT